MNPAAEVNEMIGAGLPPVWISRHSGIDENDVELIADGALTDPNLSVAQRIHDLYLLFIEIREALR
ncbi:hypothetical protein [Methylophaga sp. OBS4]|uniref:hypothetical protein n=1 Tax=Methylophaga sp. OBS4 TaxID=2991935 RepID=UPI0022556D74|nr:hypothetical protein [Methylophaga sp. OBS4]MCX4186748.1 hypothetical protein [Methylophaga sp. OBS4]